MKSKDFSAACDWSKGSDSSRHPNLKFVSKNRLTCAQRSIMRSCEKKSDMTATSRWNGADLPEVNDEFLELFGYVLAFGHYHYEADFGLKDLLERAEKFIAREGVEIETIRKLILVNVRDGYIKVDPSKTDMTNGLEPIEEDVAGTRERKYRGPVHKYYNAHGKRSYYICHFPTCLLVLMMVKKMDKNGALKLTRSQCQRVYTSFTNMLDSLLSKNPDCVKRYKMLRSESKWLHEYLSMAEDGCNARSLEEADPYSIDFTNTGFVLAVQYYFNYLLRMIPNLHRRMDAFKEEKKLPHRLFPKMIVVVPTSGIVPKKVMDELSRESIENVDRLPVQTSVMGLGVRDYIGTVYLIRSRSDDKNEKFYCYVEFAAPVCQMKRMVVEHVGNLDKTLLREEVLKFHFWCDNLLKQYRHDDHVSVILWDDEREVEEEVERLRCDPSYCSLTDVLHRHCAKVLSM